MSAPDLYITTWFHEETEAEGTFMPQLGVKSGAPSVKDVYWRCIVVYFATSIRQNPGAKHVLYCNRTTLPNIRRFSVEEFFQKHGIELVTLPFTYRVPEGWYHAFNNQFYIFDVLKHVRGTLRPDDVFMCHDSDVVWLRPAKRMVEATREHGIITFDLGIPMDENMNGLDGHERLEVFREMGVEQPADAPTYYGGEFFNATGEALDRITDEIDLVWNESIARFRAGKKKFNEEAHMLSFIYNKLGFPYHKGEPYMRQIWSTPRYRTVKPEDMQLDLWHLPAEKYLGFRRLFELLEDERSIFWTSDQSQWEALMAETFGIPNRSTGKEIRDIVHKVKKRLKR
jgi:hypothetical protein